MQSKNQAEVNLRQVKTIAIISPLQPIDIFREADESDVISEYQRLILAGDQRIIERIHGLFFCG